MHEVTSSNVAGGSRLVPLPGMQKKPVGELPPSLRPGIFGFGGQGVPAAAQSESPKVIKKQPSTGAEKAKALPVEVIIHLQKSQMVKNEKAMKEIAQKDEQEKAKRLGQIQEQLDIDEAELSELQIKKDAVVKEAVAPSAKKNRILNIDRQIKVVQARISSLQNSKAKLTSQ